MSDVKKTLVLINGKSGVGKDFLIDKVVYNLTKRNKTIFRFAHADILKKYISDLFNIELSEFYTSDKDLRYIIFNRKNLLEQAKIYTTDYIRATFKSFNYEVWDENQIKEYYSVEEPEDLYRMYDSGHFIMVSLRTLLLYFGYTIMKRQMPPFLLLFQSLREHSQTREFIESEYIIVTDNRFNEEVEFLTNYAIENGYDIKFIRITSDKSNNITNAAEDALTIDVEQYIPLEDILIIDNSDRSEYGTNETVQAISDFIVS